MYPIPFVRPPMLLFVEVREYAYRTEVLPYNGGMMGHQGMDKPSTPGYNTPHRLIKERMIAGWFSEKAEWSLHRHAISVSQGKAVEYIVQV